jgi:hypothetical protein
LVLKISTEARPDPMAGVTPSGNPTPDKQGQQRGLHMFVGSGRSLVVCHGQGHEVQWCAENERRGWRAPLMCSRASDVGSRSIRE